MASPQETLKEKVELVREQLDQIDSALQATEATEWLDGRELRKVVEAVLDDLCRLCRADHLKLYFSKAEVDTMVAHLSSLATHITNPAQILSSLNGIRPHVRSYLIRGTAQDRAEKIAEVEESLQGLEAYLAEREDLASTRAAMEECLRESKEALTTIKGQVKTLAALQTTAEQHQAAAKVGAEAVEEEKEAAEADRATVEAFVAKIAERETQLENQAAKTEAFEKQLKELGANYEADKKTRDERLNKTEGHLELIIAQAREALELNTARGLSKEFGERARGLRPGWGFRLVRSFPFVQSDNGALWWIIAAGSFVVAAGAITLLLATNLPEIVLGEEGGYGEGRAHGTQEDWFGLMSRLSVVGILITAAVFCASQYRRNQKLLEDYSYKKVVAASLHGFIEKMEEIEETDSLTAGFLRKALDEIFCHPLREESKGERLPKQSEEFPAAAIEKFVREILAEHKGAAPSTRGSNV